MLTRNFKGDQLHQTITTINYKSLITSDKRNDEIPSYMNTKCKYKLRKGKIILPYLHTREPSLPSLKSPVNKIANNSSWLSIVQVQYKGREKSMSMANETYFQKTRQASFLDNLLKQLKQKKQC